MANNDDIKWLYGKLKAKGYNIGSEQDFSNSLANEADRKWYYEKATDMGLNIGSMEDFNALYAPKHASKPVPVAKVPVAKDQPVPAARKQERAPWKPTAPEEANFYATLQTIQQEAHNTLADTNERLAREGTARAKNAFRVRRNNVGMNATPYRVGEKSNVIQTGQQFNPKTGKVDQTFMTEAGSEYKHREIADLEQGNIDDARERELDPVNTSLRDAYSERDRIDAAMKQRMKEIDEENNGVGSVLRQFVESSRQPGMTNPMQIYQMDDQYRQLESAARKNRAAIQTLEDKRDGKMNDFFHSIKTTALNGYNFTDGLAEINDAISLMDAQQHIQSINAKRQAGEPLNSEELLAEMVLRNDAFNNAVQGRYAQEYGSWATAGQMIPTSIDLMKDIMLTPGAGGIAKGIAGKVSNLGGKYLARQAGDAMTKSIAKKVGRGILKGTGVLLGAHTAGAVVSNTSGINRTAALMGTNIAGHTAVDGNGYKVEDDMGVLEAFADAERQMMRENGSEMFGEFIPGVGKFVNKGLEKMGLSKISGALTRIGNKQWYKQYNALLEAGGYNGIAGEGIEEYEGILFDALTGHAGEALDQIKNPRTHVDIWLGTAAMSAMMGAVPVTIQGFHTGQYYRYKHNTDNADKLASFRLGEDRWVPMRDRIDETPNEGMADVATEIINDESLHTEEKLAALKYIRNLTKMRGYNIGQMSNANEESEESREANESYADGYNAETNEEKQDTKNLYNLRRQKVEERFSAEGLARIDNDPITALNELGTDEQSRQIILDYVNSKQAYDGMIQRVRDDLDSRIEQSNAMVDARTNRTTGMVQGATMKQDDRKVYVLAGELVPYDDGTGIDVSASSASIIVRDAETGELEQVAPDSLLSIEEPQDPVEQKNVAAETIRQQYGNAAADVIDGVVSFNPGNTFTITGQDGQPHQIQIVPNEQGVVDNGDGTVNVSDGTNIFAVQKDLIQQQVNEQNQARVAEAERQREQELATAQQQETAVRQQEWETNRPQYAFNDNLILRDADGNLIHGQIAAVEEADGLYVVDVDHPINGKFAPNLTREQIDDMIVEYNGQPVQKPQLAEVPQTDTVSSSGESDNESTAGVTATTGIPGATGAVSLETVEPGAEVTDDSTVQIQQKQRTEPDVNQQPSAIERIPKDEQGNLLYEQAETPDVAWDAIVEQTGGDEDMAAEIVSDIIKEQETASAKAQKALKKVQDAKPETRKDGVAPTMAERIAAKKAAKEALASAQAEVDRTNTVLSVWQQIARTPQRRKNAEEERKRREDAERKRQEAEAIAAQKAEQEEAARIEREALNGVPDIINDTPQDARARGYRRVNGHKVNRQEPLLPIPGRDVSIKFSDDEISSGKVVAIDAAQLQPSHRQGRRNPSHFIDEAQPKERNDEASILSAEKIAGSIRPEEITSSVTAYTGAPTVNSRGEVIQGNNRSAALRSMWESYPEQAAIYKQYLVDHAKDFGLNAADVASMERPVLVNMLDVPDEEAIKLGQYVAQDTESGGTERIKPKNALQKMGRDVKSFANILLQSADEELSFSELVDRNGMDALKWMSSRDYITPTQYQSAFDTKGNITAEAKNDLKGILYQSIFSGGNTQLEEMFSELPAKAQKAILATAFRDFDSAESERMITEIQNSIRAYHALLQDKRFREAKNYKEARSAVEGWKKQYQMDDVSGETYLPSDNFTNFALHLATIYKGESQTFIQSIFNRLYDLIQGTQEATLFEQPDNTPRTLAQAIYEVLNIQYDGQLRSNVLAGGSAAGQQRRQGSGGSAPAGERIEDGTEPADGTGGAEGSGRQSEVTPSLFQYFTGTLSELIAQAKQSSQGLIKKVIAPISSRLKDDLNDQGLQVDNNYNHVIDNNAIRHTLKKHSGKNEGKRGQIPITDADFENIRDVVEHYDGVEVVPGNTSAQRIIYHKAYQDGTVIFVEEQRVGRKELAAVTMWKKRNPNLTDANRTETTLIPDLTEVSDYKDTTNRQKANELGENFDDAKRNEILFKNGKQEAQVQTRAADGRASEIYEGANGGGQKYEGTQGDTEGQTGGSLYIDGRQGEVPGDGLAGESWSDGSRKDDRGEVSGLPEEGTRNVSGGRASEGASGTEGFIRVAAPEDLSESPEEANAGRMDEIAERLSEIDYRLSELEEQGGMFNEAERISLNLEKSELEQEYDGLRQINEQSRAIQEAEAETNADPTEAQKKAGNYKKGHLKIDGYDVTIENPKGSQRSGTDQDGSIWSVTMNNTYGYIRGTEGVDGDHIDVFLSDNPSQGNVYVVDQVNQQTGEFDEHKVMYGFNSAEEAQEAYLANYSEGWKMGTITEVSKEEFKKWIQSSHRKTKPFAEYKGVKKVGVSEKENTTGEKDVTGGPVFPNAGSNASQPVSLESWRQMDSDGRMTEAEKRPLTREEIENAPTDEVLRANALDFLNGDRGMISSISYLKVYEDVRYSNGDSAADSGAADRTQLDETDTGIQQGLDGASGESRRVSSELLDSEQGEGTLPGPEGYVQHSPDSEERDASGAGERGNSDVSGEEQSVGGRSVRGGERRGSRSSGSHGRNGERGRVERSDQSAGNDRERRAEARRGRNSRDGGSQSIGEDIGSFIADAMKEFDSVLDEFKRAGSEDLSVSIIGLNSRQLEVLPRLISAGAKVGYAYVKNGIHEFAEWARQMRKVLGGKLSDAGLGENEIDAYIHEMWKCKLPMDGETHTIEEWAGILGKEALRKKMGQTFEDKRKAQQAAEKVAVKLCNRKNISETLPFLLPQQQEDVLKAETQFFDESHNDRDHAFGKGYMFTNGTGTGKTYTGLGIVKRFMKLGRGRVLILTPSQTKVGDWIKDAANLDIELNDLDAVAKARKDGTTATTEKGEGAVITTYANFRQNRALLEDRFDLIVYDESHRLLENKGGIGTTGAMQHYKISNRNEQFAFLRLQEINPVWNECRTKSDEFETKRSALIERLKKESGITNELTFDQRGQLPPVFNGNWTSAMEHKFPELAEIRKDALTLNSKFEKEIKPELERQAKDAVKHTKVVFLSATPFNTRENLDYAEGYIFSYPESERPDGYSVQSPRSQFYLEHFGAGYKWRYHRLESTGSNPEAVSKQEVAFSDYLQHTLQTMSGRIIDSPFDYSRDFPTVTLGKADEFNNAMEELSREEATRDSYYGVMGDYNYTSALFESMKVAQIIPRLKDHLVRGRKIVVFHRRVESKNPLIPPFKAIFDGAADALEGEYDATKKAEKKKKIAALRRKYAGMLEWEQTLDLRMPREQLADAFGKDGVLFFSGKESKKTKDKAVADFNSDTSGKNIIVIQESSGKEGISLHDTTGNHQRVLVTLALPQSPITALQIEGRIYRIGNKSNAIFEYPLLGLNTELMLFGQKFNQQVSTTENLALGSQARNLRESFARGVEEHSGDVDLDSQGVGGKEFDAAKPTESDAFDGAVLDYYTNQRLTGKRDSREGIDYYPTPEPLGFMMSQWGHIGEGESVLEPSAGHGAIARYVPKENPLTAIEPSQSLFSKLQIKASGNGRKFENTIFENYNVVNKHDVVLMNPPFGTGGRIAVDHVAKAFQHLEEGGRIVAIIPRGSTDKKFAKWYEEQKGAMLSAEIVLPDITFERAGTSVNCRVVVIDKVTNEALRSSAVSRATHIDLSGKHYEKIEDFFDEIRDIDVPVRTIDHKARLKKKAAPVARELRTVKGIKYVDLEADRIYVSGNDVWAEIKWGDMKGEELTSYLADRYKIFKSNYDYAAQNGKETHEAAYGELKALACKLAGMTEDEMQRYIGRRNDDVLFRSDDALEEVNERFNEELDKFSIEEADKIYFDLGSPSEILLSAGVADKPMKLYGNKVIKKMKKHGFKLEELHDLPKAVANPITVFNNYNEEGNRSILTELRTEQGNFLVLVSVGKDADVDFNIVRSVFGKGDNNVIGWINKGFATYIDKEKALSILSHQSAPIAATAANAGLENSKRLRLSAPIAEASNSQELSDATKVVESFKNPSISEENLRNGTGFVSNSELSLANDPMAQVTGRSRIGSRQQAFADRERERMVDRVQQLAKKLHLDNVEIVTDASTLEGKRSKAKGFYSPKTGKITIVIPNHTSVSDAVVTLLHEAVAHYGLRQMFGEHFNTFLDNVFKNADESIRNKIIDLAKKHGWDFHTATEEYLAGLAEQTNFDAALSSGWWNKIKTLFLEMLRKIGFEGFGGVTLTDNELRYILWRSYENLAEPGRFRNILGQAADIAKQYELKVGDYASKPLPTDIKVSEADELEAVNEKFNEDLKRYKNGEMDKNEMFHLGYPRGVMQLFLPNFPIVMRQRVVKKGSEKKHDVPLHAISDMPSMISDPIFVFQRDANNIGILTDMTDNDGKNVCVAIELGKTIQNGKEYLEVNDIRSFHGRDVKYIVEPIIYNNTLRYANKSKGLTWLSSASQPVQQEIDKQDLLSATNIVRIFENPNGADEKDLLYRDGDPEVSDEKDEDPDKMDAIVSAREIYEEAVKDTGEDCLVKALFKSLTNGRAYRVRFKNKFAESHFDYTRSVEKLQEAIEKATGRPIQSFENTWQALNYKSSVDSIELQRVKSLYIDPLFEHVGRMIKGKKMNGRQITADDVEIYLNALHGPERNQYMGERDAEAIAIRKNGGYREEPRDPEDPDYDLRHEQWKEWRKAVDKKKADLLAHRKDYSGLTALFGDQVEDKKDVEQLEAAADRYCHEFEAAIGDVGMIEELKQKVRDLNHWSVKKAYLSGLISKDLYDQTLSMYDNYVPLRGWHDDYAGDVYGYISNGADKDVQGVMKRAYGRKSRAAHIFGTMAAMANTAIVQGNKNIVAQKFFNCAQNHADSGLLLVSKQWYQKMADGSLKALNPTLHNGMSAEEMREEIERHDAEMKHQSAKKETGVKLYTNRFDKHFPMKMAKWEQKQHSVRVMRNGVEYQVYVLGNPRAAQAINGLLVRDTQVGAIGKFIMKVMRFRAAVQTKYNAEFPISNFERDVYTSAMSMFIKYGGQYKGKGITRKFLNNLRKVMPLGQNPVKSNLNGGGIFTLLNRYRKGTLDQNDPMQRLFAEFCDHGGVTGISNLYNEEQFDDQMKSTILRIRHKGLDIPMKAAESFFGAVGFVNSGIENATRFATYMTLREAGANVSDSIFAAKEASVNFNRKGSGAWGNLWMRRYILYSNVALQALRMLGTWHDANKKRFYSVMATNVLASYTTAMLYHLVGQLWGDDDDDDGEKESDWYHLSEWNRYNYINLKNPVGNGYFHYSIPQEFRPAWALGQIIYDWQAGRVSEKQATLSMLTQVNNLAPMAFIAGGTDSKDGFIDGFIKAWTPTLAEDFIDVYHWNEDFLGRPITNQYDWNEMEPEWQRAGEETPQWAISLSRKWNAATGGADHRRGISESKYLNPSALYYLLEQQAGGVGTMATKITRAVEQWQDPELELELKNIPFVSKFWVGTADDYSKNRVLNDRFYFYWNEFNAIDHDISATRSDFRNDEISEEEYDKHMQELEESGDLEFWYHMKDYSEDYSYLLKLSREGDKEASAELLELKKEVVSTLEKEKAGQAE